MVRRTLPLSIRIEKPLHVSKKTRNHSEHARKRWMFYVTIRCTSWSAKFFLPGAPFDIVFLDPPYAFEGEQIRALLDSLVAVGALAPNALIVYEHGATTLGIAQESMVSVKSKRYGIACVDFMRLRVDHQKSLGEKSAAAEDKIRNQVEGEICGED